ncbi:MAG: ATP-binding cassette domain-containing protein, partial [Tepidisphaerales bacterium]
MDEVFDLCDAATVLRDGKHVRTWDSLAGVTRDQLVGAMVGRSIADVFQYQPRPHGDVLLRVENLLGRGLAEPVSFDVKAGEIVGLFGLVGAGRTELLKLIYGAERASNGRISVAGQPIRFTHPCQAIRQGIVLCPEDRKKEGVVAIRPVWENINISARRHFSPLGFFLDHGRENANARQYIDTLSIRTPTIQQPVSRLSGGNQQKVILARWLAEDPRVVLL